MAAVIFQKIVTWPNPLDSEEPLIRFGAMFVLAVLIALVTYLVARTATNRLERGLHRGGMPLNVAILIGRALGAAVWTVGLLVLLYRVFGVGITPITAVIGIVGLAASLSLQSLLQNLIAGVYLLAERPFHIGDIIAVVGPNGANHEGTVQDVQMRTTLLRSRDDELIIVPNSTMVTGVVTNRTAVGGYVSHVTVTFPRATDPEQVRHKIFPLLAQGPSILSRPQPRLHVDKVTKDDWTAALSFWADTIDAASHAVWIISQAFPEATVSTADASGSGS